MTAKEMADDLRAGGMDESLIAQLVNNAAFQQKAGQFARQSELTQLQTRSGELERAAAESGDIKKWYTDNWATIQRQNVEIAQFYERYGPISGAAVPQAQPTGQPQQQPQYRPQAQQQQPQGVTAEQVKAMIENDYGPQITRMNQDTGRVVEKHLRSGRKHDIDWNELYTKARDKGGDLLAAYNEWDSPHQQADAAAQRQKEVDALVEKEVEKRVMQLSGAQFPGGGDSGYTGTSPLSTTNADGTPKTYDRNALIQAANEVMRSPDYRPGFKM